MVNEVVPHDRLLDRAKQLAAHIMNAAAHHAPPHNANYTASWKKRITDDLDGGLASRCLRHLAKKKSIHSRNHIATSVAYVKEGKENNIK